jgi:hypothetical protein
MIEELRALGSSMQVNYFFFNNNQNEKNNSSSTFRAILAQILQQNRKNDDLLNRFTFAMGENSAGQMTASSLELLDLLSVCLPCMENSFLVLDAIDECNDQSTLVQKFVSNACAYGIKVVLFSRPNVESLWKATRENRQVVIQKESNNEDIKMFFNEKVQDLADEQLLPAHCDSTEIVSRLLRGSAGMFLWARLMIGYLRSRALSPSQRLSSIYNVNLPEGLDQMYRRIFSLIQQAPYVEQQLAVRTLIFLTWSKRPLDSRELLQVLKMGSDGDISDFPESRFGHDVRLVCAGLVELEPNQHGDSPSRLQFIHLSVKEWLMSCANLIMRSSLDDYREGLDSALSSESEARIQIARECVTYLCFQTPAHPLSGSLFQKAFVSDLRRSLPFLEYASTYWVDHLCEIPLSADYANAVRNERTKEKLDDLLNLVRRLLKMKLVLLAWVESLYTFSTFSSTSPLMRLRSQTKVNWNANSLYSSSGVGFQNWDVIDELQEFAHDMQALHDEWGSTLVSSPNAIWEDVTAFTKSRFFAKTSAVQVETLRPRPPSGYSHGPPLYTISQTSASGREMGVLSIWPSRYISTSF